MTSSCLRSLKVFDNGAPGIFGQGDGAALVQRKVTRRELRAVDQRDNGAVGGHGPQLLHQVEGEAGPARAQRVQKADLRIEADRLTGAGALARQQRVNVIQDRVDGVRGRGGGSARPARRSRGGS